MAVELAVCLMVSLYFVFFLLAEVAPCLPSPDGDGGACGTSSDCAAVFVVIFW